MVRDRPASLAEAYSAGRSNSIGFLRWAFAAAVIVYHGYIIAAFTRNPIDRELGGNLGRTAVDRFFVLSGFLVARSYRSSRGIADFLWKRALRIYPAFWLCLTLTVVLFAPLSWLHSHGDLDHYWDVHPWRYLTRNWTLHLHSAQIPGTFRDTRLAAKTHVGIPNGSLWTLFYELRCYLVVGALGVAALLCAAVRPLTDRNLALLLFAFLVGSCLALYAERVTLDDQVGLACIVAVLLVVRWQGNFGTLAIVPLGYAILWLRARAGERS